MRLRLAAEYLTIHHSRLPDKQLPMLSAALEIGLSVMRENMKLSGAENGGVGYSANGRLESNDALSNRPHTNRSLDRAGLQALRRVAAGIERPEQGIFLRVEANGQAIATGPKGARTSEAFRRLAHENGLEFFVGIGREVYLGSDHSSSLAIRHAMALWRRCSTYVVPQNQVSAKDDAASRSNGVKTMMDKDNKGFPSWSQMDDTGRFIVVMIVLTLVLTIWNWLS